jgi:hypothetical protein
MDPLRLPKVYALLDRYFCTLFCRMASPIHVTENATLQGTARVYHPRVSNS